MTIMLMNTRLLLNLRQSIQNKIRGLLFSGIVLWYNNTRPNASGKVQLLQNFGWNIALILHQVISSFPAVLNYLDCSLKK